MLLVALKFRSNSIEINYQYDWKCILSIAAVCVDGARSDTITYKNGTFPESLNITFSQMAISGKSFTYKTYNRYRLQYL